MFDFKERYLALSPEQRARFCDAAETSHSYLLRMLLPRRRMPRVSTIDLLVKGCKALRMGITRDELVKWFYVDGAK